jgi:hypothetical protein
MRVELRTRDGDLLGSLDLQVSPAVVQQALFHTQVVLGDTVDEAPVAECAETEPKPKSRTRRSRKGAKA